jgi:hypothetical protein
MIKNWRPISLLSCFYKIWSKAVDARLEKVIDKVTSMSQKAYNKKRYIQESLINTIDTIRHCEHNGVKGAILSIDQKKAFDSVYHGYMREVYRFFGFGPGFIRLLETIGTKRSARIIFENNKLSCEISLDRGFAQGNSPSPKKYNIGEQILLFRLEFDPHVRGVYNNFLIPRHIEAENTRFPMIEQAVNAGLVVDDELKETERRNSAFADDTTGAYLRTAENLSLVKNILYEFGQVSGLETNIEKTSLMPVGLLTEILEPEIIALGFDIVDEIKCLGMTINNRSSSLENHFDEKILKVRQLIGSWSRFNLSLPGRIAISKTMLISQLGYIGCIVTPTAAQLTTLQTLIDAYVKGNVVIAADRLYLKPTDGGLGLIKLSHYFAALQCSWVKRCSVNINDQWRWTLAVSCNFQLDLLRVDNISATFHPILFNIAKSFGCLQTEYWKLHENFLQAPLVDNIFFLRQAPERRRPVRGCVDRNLLGHDFYDRNNKALRNLRMSSLLRGDRIVSREVLNRTTGLIFSEAVYMHLSTAAAFAKTKYANKDNSNGTALPLKWLLGRIKKGSKRFRTIIGYSEVNNNPITDLRVVQTFFGIIDNPVPANTVLKALYGCWNWNFLGNRMRTFCFQFYNNSLSVGARLRARYVAGGVNIDDRCSFCIKAGYAVPGRETFIHLFFECPQLIRIRDFIIRTYHTASEDERTKKMFCVAGYNHVGSVTYNFFVLMTSIFYNYIIWQSRNKKTIPSIATICNEIDNYFDNAAICSKFVYDLALENGTPICRRWRERHNRRG